jgi:hypothetical protein
MRGVGLLLRLGTHIYIVSVVFIYALNKKPRGFLHYEAPVTLPYVEHHWAATF